MGSEQSKGTTIKINMTDKDIHGAIFLIKKKEERKKLYLNLKKAEGLMRLVKCLPSKNEV